jgi:hypothetical protein
MCKLARISSFDLMLVLQTSVLRKIINLILYYIRTCFATNCLNLLFIYTLRMGKKRNQLTIDDC